MHRLMMLAAVAFVFCLACGCRTTGDTVTVTPPADPGKIVLEVEKSTLTDCAAVKLAGGARGVRFDKENAKAKGTVVLRKGAYEVVAYVQGESPDEDAVYVTIGAGEPIRIYGDEHGQVSAAIVVDSDDEKFFVFTADKDGPYDVVFTFGEKNVAVDRIEFQRKD